MKRTEKKTRKKPVEAKKLAESPKWTPYEVMLFAGDIMNEVIKLAEKGNAHEKRVCQRLVRGAECAVKQVRHQRFIQSLGL